jgi:hypothetical protein
MPVSRRAGIDENQTALLGGHQEMNKFSRHLETGSETSTDSEMAENSKGRDSES